MSTVTGYPVYTGFWTNWSDGKVMGATLTLTNSSARLLSAFVVFYLTVVTTRLWAIISFGVHAAISTSEARGTLHHQRQALLRNNGGPAGTAWTLARMAYLWRKSPRTIGQILPLLVGTVLLAAGFAVAAVFSSRVNLGNEVLLRPQSCMVFSPNRTPMQVASASVLAANSRWIQDAANYAQQCYPNNQSALVSACTNHPYVQQRLPFSVNTTASCPFDSELYATQTNNLLLDTGLMDTHNHLGINAPPDERLQYRLSLHCAPLVTNGYSDTFRIPGNNSFTRYYYGDNGFSNYTFEYPSASNILNQVNYTNEDADWAFHDYTLQ